MGMSRSTGRSPPGRATSAIISGPSSGAVNSPPNAPAMPVSVCALRVSGSARVRLAIQSPRPPPSRPRPPSGPRLAPPISDTAETATDAGTTLWSTCASAISANRSGCRAAVSHRRIRPTRTPKPVAMGIHHHLPPAKS